MKKQTKSKIHQIEIGVAILLLFIGIISFFPNRGITGFVSLDTKTQKINLTISNSQSYILTTKNTEPFYLTSLKLSGEVIGKGNVKAYLASKNEKKLIYSNLIKKESGLDSITGMSKISGAVVGVASDENDYLIIDFLENIEDGVFEKQNNEIFSGRFNDNCVDSCFIKILLDKDTAYDLLFYVEKGTILKISEIIYSIGNK